MPETRTISTGEAIRDGLTEAAIKNPSVIFLAEGIADPSSVYGTTAGIGKHIAPERSRTLGNSTFTGPMPVNTSRSGK